MTPKQIIPVLKTAITNRFPVLIQSSPGCGKSDIVTQIAKELDYNLVIMHPTICDPIDFRGMPCIVNGEADFKAFGDLKEICETKKNTIALFDDVGNSTAATQAALLQIVLARELNGKKISDKVSFIAATNRRKDNCGISGLIKSLVSRFNTILELQPDVNDWKSWAINNNVPIELISFLNFRPELISNFNPLDKEINNFACPRTITNLGKWISAGCLEISVWEGAVGTAFATEFAAFYRTYKSLAGLPEKIIMDPLNTEIPTNQATLFALIGSLSHKSTEKNFDAILQYIDRCPTEFAIFYMKDAIAKKPNLAETDAFITWNVKHSDVTL